MCAVVCGRTHPGGENSSWDDGRPSQERQRLPKSHVLPVGHWLLGVQTHLASGGRWYCLRPLISRPVLFQTNVKRGRLSKDRKRSVPTVPTSVLPAVLPVLNRVGAPSGYEARTGVTSRVLRCPDRPHRALCRRVCDLCPPAPPPLALVTTEPPSVC